MLFDAFSDAYGWKKEKGFEVEEKAFIPINLIAKADELLNTTKSSPYPTMETKYRVSALSRLCVRQEVLRYIHKINGVEKINHITQKTFDFGSGFHFIVQNQWFGKWGWLYGDWLCTGCGKKYLNQLMPKQKCSCGSDNPYHYIELSLESSDHFLTGHPDGILKIDGQDYLMELKTSNKIYYEKIKGDKVPLDAHRDQINMYMFLLGMKHGLVIYFNKDNSDWMQFYEKYNEKRVEKQLNKIKLIKEGIEKREAPKERICESKTCSAAKRCPIRDICFK